MNLINKIFSRIPTQINGKDAKLSEFDYHNFLFELLDDGDKKQSEKLIKDWRTNDFTQSDPILFIKPFLFYDVGLIGNNLYHSAGIGINIYGLQFILASRLDRDTDNWSILFDFAGFFGRANYLAK